jgi:acid phosphatase
MGLTRLGPVAHLGEVKISPAAPWWRAVAWIAAVAPIVADPLPTPDHVVIVVEENHSYEEIFGNAAAPYINSLAASGAVFTQSYGIGHPSQPNYLQLFSGSNQGVTDNTVPAPGSPFATDNLGSLLIGAGLTFAGYSEGLPSVGSLVASSGAYQRKHNPWSDFSNVPAGDNLPFTSFPDGTHYADLATVSIVVPDQNHDMHDGTIAAADSWLQTNLGLVIDWLQDNNGLFILTFDEDDSSALNHILTFAKGPMVVPGQYDQTVDHHNLLRTVEDMYGLGYAGNSAEVAPFTSDAFAVPEASDAMAFGAAGLVLAGAWEVRRRRRS